MRFHPLGYPVELITQNDAVLRAACQSWRAWAPLFDHQIPVRVEIEIHPGSAPRHGPVFAVNGRLEFRCDDRNFAWFHPETHSGRMVLSAAVLSDPVRFRHHFLEALVLSALDAVFFTPLHAACVARGGRGILLCGDSGAGKSSLAYACARQGWTLVSDDAVHLAPGPERTGVGGSNLIHLRAPARDLFPELDAWQLQTTPNGKAAMEIDAAAHGFHTARHTAVTQCVFLRRRPGPPAMTPYPAEAAVEYFLKYIEPRDTTAAAGHLREFLKQEPILLEYDTIGDAVSVLEALEP